MPGSSPSASAVSSSSARAAATASVAGAGMGAMDCGSTVSIVIDCGSFQLSVLGSDEAGSR
jgi:hypothetical protein